MRVDPGRETQSSLAGLTTERPRARVHGRGQREDYQREECFGRVHAVERIESLSKPLAALCSNARPAMHLGLPFRLGFSAAIRWRTHHRDEH